MNEEIERIHITLAQAEARVEKANKWEKLMSNPLFEELITEDYLGDDAVRLTMNLKPKNTDNEIVLTLLQAKSAFSRYVAQVLEEGNQAAYSIKENSALMNELEQE